MRTDLRGYYTALRSSFAEDPTRILGISLWILRGSSAVTQYPMGLAAVRWQRRRPRQQQWGAASAQCSPSAAPRSTYEPTPVGPGGRPRRRRYSGCWSGGCGSTVDSVIEYLGCGVVQHHPIVEDVNYFGTVGTVSDKMRFN